VMLKPFEPAQLYAQIESLIRVDQDDKPKA